MSPLPTAPSGGVSRTGARRTPVRMTAASVVGSIAGRSRGRLIAAIVLAAAGAAVALVLLRQVRLSLEDLVAAQLEGSVAAQAAAVGAWFDRQRERAATTAADPEVIELVSALAADSADVAQRMQALRLALEPVAGLHDVLSYVVADPSGTIVAAADDREVGKPLSARGQALTALAAQTGGAVFEPLFGGALVGDGSGRGTPFVPAVAPIHDGVGRRGTLFLRIDPRPDLERFFEEARSGRTGETYAFDRAGRMLTPTRFEDLVTGGVIPVERDTSGEAVTFLVRDPGVDLTAGGEPAEAPGRWPLTRAVASAIAGESGRDSRGYRDYRGVTVLGAWRWLDDPGIGVVTEIDRAEALAVLAPLRVANWSLVALGAIAAGAWVWSRLRIDRLLRRVDTLRQLGQYTLEAKIGEGGMGKVFRARHAFLQRPTAVKMLDPDHLSEEAVGRFEREVQVTSRLTHPNTVSIYDYGRTPDGVFYYAMEHLSGYTLAKLIEDDGPQPEERVLEILRQACGSLREAHTLGVVHRDIKPANMMLVVQGGVPDHLKILDFGLVRQISHREEGLTQVGIVAGTPAYIPPERLRDPDAIDVRGDIYALGCVAYGLLVGRPAYHGHSGADTAARALSEPTPRVSADLGVEVCPALDDLIFSCMAKDPDERPSSVAELLAVLAAIDVASPWTEERATAWWRRWGPAVGVELDAPASLGSMEVPR